MINHPSPAEDPGATVGSPQLPGTIPVEPLTEKPGDRISRYKLLQEIGEGGCGIVYMAEQQEPVRRRVALKIIKLGMDTKQVVARFEAERQALALMDHPNIAKVLDAGATETGRPFFVMELVRGVPITEYCDQNNLSAGARLSLFIQVCHAIQHAHQKGIIHRDIKPSNILVTAHDGVPVPKVIDFGIAKAMDQPLTEKTLFTRFEQFMGTPAYMSPEQAEMSTLDIDTRSDIYALGVLLYELLTGQTPFDSGELAKLGIDGMRRAIREQEPPKPSTRLTTLANADLTTVAKHRGAEPGKLSSLVRGDLDWIVMKCLEKDRTRRYDTANGLALDIQRYLDNEPVVARPPSNLYRFQKLVRRNKLAFAAASAITAALVLGLGLSTWMFFKEKQARQRALAAEQQQTYLRQQAEAEKTKAQTEAIKSQQVARFLTDMLKGVGPSVALGRDTTMLREIVDRTAERVGTDLKDEPKVQSELYLTLADTYHELGSFKLMERMAREALRLARSSPGEESLAVADALGRLGDALHHLEIKDEAEGVLRQAIAMERKLRGAESLQEAAALYHLGYVLLSRGMLDEAETSSRTSLAMRRKLLGNRHTDVARSLDGVSYVLQDQNKLQEAEALSRESLSLRKQLFGEKHPELARSFHSLGHALARQRRYAEAETSYRDAIALATKDSGDLWQLSMAGLADTLRDTGRLGEAENLYRELLPATRKRLGDGHRSVVSYCQSLAEVLRQQGKLDEAEAVLRELLNAQNAEAAALINAEVAARAAELPTK